MSEKVAHQTAKRILEHCKYHDIKEIAIVFHGGEPLLGGVPHLQLMHSIIEKVFKNSNIEVSLGMQSNGLLFTSEIGDFLLSNKITIGISIDGPPKINDLFRVDHQGNPTSSLLEKKLKLLTSPKYEKIFSGFLSVVNISSDPIEVFEYLSSYKPRGVDFLLPLNNYDNIPVGKEKDIDVTPYADWLIKIFNYWFSSNKDVEIRLFNAILRRIFGQDPLVELIGLIPSDLIVIETNGEIEAVDTLKSTYNGATRMNYNVFDQSFDIVAHDPIITSRQIGINALCQTCRNCPVVEICGGGYLPHRYSSQSSFNNPSVYCKDLEKLIRHIYDRVSEELKNSKISPSLGRPRNK